MLGLISFILVIIGGINWFCIGLLQFDFVAGLFGSQSSIFSRLVYIAVGLGVLVLLFNLIENKGQIKFNFKKHMKQAMNETSTTYYEKPRTADDLEASSDQSLNTNNDTQPNNHNTNDTANIHNESDHIRQIESLEQPSNDSDDNTPKSDCDKGSCRIDKDNK